MSLRFFEDFWAGLPPKVRRTITLRQRRTKRKVKSLTDLDFAALSIDYYEMELARVTGALEEATRRLAQATSENAALQQAQTEAKAIGTQARKRAAQRSLGVFALIRDNSGKLLLVRQADGRWALPGGKLKASETIMEGLAREVREETGLRIVPEGLAAVVCREWRDYLGLIFEVHVKSKRLPKPCGEIEEVRYCGQGHWPASLTPQTDAVIASAVQSPSGHARWLEVLLP